MKRVKESGAAFRKKKKAKEEEAAKNKGALLKFIQKTSTPTAEVAEAKDDIHAETEDEVDIANIDTAEGAIEHVDDAETVGDAEDGAREVEALEGQPLVGLKTDIPTDFTDVGMWPVKIDHEIRAMIVQQGYAAVQHLECEFKEVTRPGTKTKGDTRKLTKTWFFRDLRNGEKSLRTWMVYSPLKEALFCFCCRLFSTGLSSFSAAEGFRNWWKLNPKVHEHEDSTSHAQAFLYWKELEIRLAEGKTINKAMEGVIEKETKKWRKILARLLDIVRFLSKQNLALRGHREDIHKDEEGQENRGNFLELVHLLAKYDPVLREHLVKVKLGKKIVTSYLSPEVQNEFVSILAEHVRKKIIAQIKESKYFCIIFDSTPDISHKDQMSEVLRYVKLDGNEVKVQESFLRFIETKGKSAEEISRLILAELENDGLPIDDCRGQAYDNAAVMAGHRSGVQKRISEINPKALFVPCSNHSLNLACVHAASVSIYSVTCFGTLDQLFSFFSASTHRWDVLIQVTGLSIKRLVETTWSSRADAVNVVANKLSEVVTALEQLTEEGENVTTRTDASLILTSLLSFPFLSFLSLWKSVLPEINDAQKYLQTKGLDLHQSSVKLTALRDYLLQNREAMVDSAMHKSKKLCSEMGISMERRIRKKK
ncbi:zinc finger MYM-type protein 1-like [Dendrobates tinctorius]|uniref:zinc finger MYM-type protein 1-like n=1 Tax=Dendrobates tinctorius TaxID=92724 RepID=UPI003CCA0F14